MLPATTVEAWGQYWAARNQDPVKKLPVIAEAVAAALHYWARLWMRLRDPATWQTRREFGTLESTGWYIEVDLMICPIPSDGRRLRPFEKVRPLDGLLGLWRTMVEMAQFFHVLDSYCGEIEQSWVRALHHAERFHIQAMDWVAWHEAIARVHGLIANAIAGSCWTGCWRRQVEVILTEWEAADPPPVAEWRASFDRVQEAKEKVREIEGWREHSPTEIRDTFANVQEMARLEQRLKQIESLLTIAHRYGDIPPLHVWYQAALLRSKGQPPPPDFVPDQNLLALKRRIPGDQPLVDRHLWPFIRRTAVLRPSEDMPKLFSWVLAASLVVTLFDRIPLGPYEAPPARLVLPPCDEWPATMEASWIGGGDVADGLPYSLYRVEEIQGDIGEAMQKEMGNLGLLVIHGGPIVRMLVCHQMLRDLDIQPTLGLAGLHPEGRCVVHPETGVLLLPLVLAPFARRDAIEALGNPQNEHTLRRRENLERWVRACVLRGQSTTFHPERWVWFGDRLAELVPGEVVPYAPDRIEPLLSLLAKHWTRRDYQTFVDCTGLAESPGVSALVMAAAIPREPRDGRLKGTNFGESTLARTLIAHENEPTAKWIREVAPDYSASQFEPLLKGVVDGLLRAYSLGGHEDARSSGDGLESLRSRVADLLLEGIRERGPLSIIPDFEVEAAVEEFARRAKLPLRDVIPIATEVWREAAHRDPLTKEWLRGELERRGCYCLRQAEFIWRCCWRLWEAQHRHASIGAWEGKMDALARGDEAWVREVGDDLDRIEPGLGMRTKEQIHRIRSSPALGGPPVGSKRF